MKVIYISQTDTLTMILSSAEIVESDEGSLSEHSHHLQHCRLCSERGPWQFRRQGRWVAREQQPKLHSTEGNLVSLEMLDASQRVRSPSQIKDEAVPIPA